MCELEKLGSFGSICFDRIWSCDFTIDNSNEDSHTNYLKLIKLEPEC